ncbi:hypothetical protein AZ035_001239, partial [Klebsiella aerogenes]
VCAAAAAGLPAGSRASTTACVSA